MPTLHRAAYSGLGCMGTGYVEDCRFWRSNKGTVCCGARVGFCAGLRTPATATLPHAPTAGVGNWPRDEIAEGGAPRVRLALWGFELARRDDGGGSAP